MTYSVLMFLEFLDSRKNLSKGPQKWCACVSGSSVLLWWGAQDLMALKGGWGCQAKSNRRILQGTDYPSCVIKNSGLLLSLLFGFAVRSRAKQGSRQLPLPQCGCRMQRPVCSIILPPGTCFPPAFRAHPQEAPPQWREWSLCILWGACYCAACFKAPGIPVHRTASVCSTRCASWVSLKKVLTQVFSYK